MRKIFIILIFLSCVTKINAQVGLWTWVSGDTNTNLPPHFGTQGIADSLNHPTGGYEGCEWIDKKGNFWFFEGSSIMIQGHPVGAWRNDLWKYDPPSKMWAWMKGTGVPNDTGNYGIQGVSSVSNLPPCRGFGMASWTDTVGNLWMYGGLNYISNFNSFNDLWKYDINTNNWTWINGSKIPNQPPVRGVMGIPSPLNTPGARSEAVCTWIDDSNNLWLFGGSPPGAGAYNDLWKYSIATNQWTWMKGLNYANAPGVYGIQGVEDSLNVPSARASYSRWKDNNGNFWLFGGFHGVGSDYLNDMWKYNISTNNWTWIKGPNNITLDIGLVGNICEEDTSSNPISRFENRSCWKDNDGNFWMFGGGALNLAEFPSGILLNDMWKYSITSNEWVLVWSDTTYYSKGNYGIKGVTTPCNKPYGTQGAVSWFEPSTNTMYLFGGYQYLIPGDANYRSAMWKYAIETPCSVHECTNAGTPDIENTNEFSIFPNPITSTLTITGEFYNKQKIELSIYTILGERIYYSKEESNGGIFLKEINMQQNCNGIYFVQLQTTDTILTKKIFKQ